MSCLVTILTKEVPIPNVVHLYQITPPPREQRDNIGDSAIVLGLKISMSQPANSMQDFLLLL